MKKNEIDFESIISKEEVLKLAIQTEFSQRSGGKIDPYEFLLILVFRSLASVPPGLTLLASFLNLLVTREALHQRFNKRTEVFFKKCLSLILSRRLLAVSPLKTDLSANFSEILIIDSSSWKIPEALQWVFPGCGGDGGKAGCKLQFCYDYLTGEFKILEQMEGKLPDQKFTRKLPATIKKGGMVLFDLGYWAFECLSEISRRGSCFVSRLNTQIQLWEKKNGEFFPVDLMKTLTHCKHQSIEFDLYLKKGATFLKVRLVGHRVPDDVVNTRRRKVRRNAQKRGGTASSRSMFYCDWSLFITNADAEILPGEMLRTLYRLRWNVELIFKSWKSVLGMHKTNVRKNSNRLKCELYAKLILATIVHRIHHHLNSYMWNYQKRELSLDKLWKYVQARIGTFHEQMLLGPLAFSAYVNSLCENIMLVCEKKHQNKRKTTLQLIDEMIGDPKPVKGENELKFTVRKKLA